MTITLSEGRFWALAWLIRRNARQIAVGSNRICNIEYFYFRDNSCISLTENSIRIMSLQGNHIIITKE